uniref:Uncharacterized protein n=1 Tax=Chenopodium quinoa TaxID=63459 RepID=A0A803NDZ6_CHEQI
MGNSPVSVLVMANNELGGCIPSSIGDMGYTLNEIIMSNDNLSGCLPEEIGNLKHVTVFDVSYNNLSGSLPLTINGMASVEQLDVGYNQFTGVIPEAICLLPNLQNFTYSHNYFTGDAPSCSVSAGAGKVIDGSQNCIIGEANQRSAEECASPLATPVDCYSFGCIKKPVYTPSPSYTPTYSPPPYTPTYSPSPSYTPTYSPSPSYTPPPTSFGGASSGSYSPSPSYTPSPGEHKTTNTSGGEKRDLREHEATNTSELMVIDVDRICGERTEEGGGRSY